jgi:anti-sigma factor RsiW
MTITDTELIAFLDGELDDSRLADIEAALAADPALAARAEQLAASDLAVRRAFDAVLAEPVPAALLAAAGTAPAAVVDLAAARAARQAAPAVMPSSSRPRWWLPTSLAATLALGLGMGTLLPRMNNDAPIILADASGTRAGPALAAALSTARSGTDVAVAGATVRGVISVRAGDGRLCRQFSLRQSAASLEALACRTGDRWQIEVASSAPPAGGDYALAAGPGEAAISAALDSIGASAPLDAEAEARALAGR